jgi:glutamyl-tRNA synthetase
MRYDGRCRERQEPRPGVTPVVRFRNPETGEVVVDDLVRGRVVFRNEELDDLIILRSDGTPTYNFCVVIDDFDMAVTHVIRGDDHLNNTPRQMNMLGALGVRPPVYAHLPMILGPDGAKLSKRHGAVDIRDYREQGYLPEALLNYIVRLGWSHGDREVFSVDEMIALFDVADVNQSASAFNPEKLRWLNQQHIIATRADTLGAQLEPYLITAGMDIANGPSPQAVADAYRERAETLVQMAASARYLYEDFEAFDTAAAKKHLRPVVHQPLQDVRTAFADLDDWQPATIAAAIERVAAAHELGLGKLGQPVRVAVTGAAVSPPIDVTVYLVGQRRAVDRIDRALDYIAARGTATA